MAVARRSKRLVGHVLILLGIALPLYGFGFLSKGILTEKSAYERFMKSDVGSYSQVADSIEEYNADRPDEVAVVDPFATDEYEAAESFLENPEGIFAYLSIPKLDLYQPIFLDASKRNLAKGVAHIEGTDLPGRMEGLRPVIAGHRGYYESVMFMYLDELAEGDSVFIQWADNSMEYKVYNKEIIQPWEVEKLDPIEGRKLLTLLTCNPMRPPRRQRLLVNCELVENTGDAAKGNEAALAEGGDDVVAQKVKHTNMAVLIVTAILALLFIWRCVKFAGEFKREDE